VQGVPCTINFNSLSKNFFRLKTLQVKNFKSIWSDKMELGQINVFIGENGSGKSNLLEALAVMSAAKQERLDIEGLYSKGVRVAKPELTFSSFLGYQPQNQIEIDVVFQSEKPFFTIKSVDYLKFIEMMKVIPKLARLN